MKAITVSTLLFILFVPDVFGSSLTISVPSKISGIDPVQLGTVHHLYLVTSYCSTLTRVSDDGEIEGHLLESWKISKNLTKYTLRLKNNIYFHDGSKLTSRDVAISLSRHFWTSNNSNYKIHLEFAFGPQQRISPGTILPFIEPTGMLDLTINIPQPYTPLLSMLSQSGLCIVKTGKTMVGTGPFKIISDGSTGNPWIFEAFNKYFGKRPQVDKLIFVQEQNSPKNLHKLFSGQFDVSIGNHLSDVDASGLGEVGIVDFFAINHFLLNPRKNHLERLPVRKALGEALQAIAWKKENISKFQVRSRAIHPNPVYAHYKVDTKPDADKKFRELSNLLGNTKKKLKIIFMKGFFSAGFLSDLRTYLKGYSVQSDIDIVDGSEFKDLLVSGDYDVVHYPYALSFNDPDGLFIALGKHFGSKNGASIRQLAKYRHLNDPTKRILGYVKGFQKIEDQWILVPAYSLQVPYISRKGIKFQKSSFRNVFEPWNLEKNLESK